MPDDEVQSQSTFEGASGSTSGSIEASSSVVSPLEDRVTACEKLVNEAVENNWPASELADALKRFKLKAIEAVDYIEELGQRLEIRRAKARVSGSPPHDPLAESSSHVEDQEQRDKAVEEAAWAALRSKLGNSAPATSQESSSNTLERVLELLGKESSPSTTLSKSVIAVAPHLAEDEDSVFNDPYLGETQKCKIAYASQKPFENLIIKAQGRKVQEPVANSIWKLIILDKYVDFEKLYATLDPEYNPNDEAKDLNEKFTLLEKNSINSK